MDSRGGGGGVVGEHLVSDSFSFLYAEPWADCEALGFKLSGDWMELMGISLGSRPAYRNRGNVSETPRRLLIGSSSIATRFAWLQIDHSDCCLSIQSSRYTGAGPLETQGGVGSVY